MSEISNLSREALIDLIHKQKNKKMGSYPKTIITSRIPCHLNLVIKKQLRLKCFKIIFEFKC